MLLKIVIALVIGATGGALLGATRTCTDGGCPLTANPRRGAVYGATLGLLFVLATGQVLKQDPPPVSEQIERLDSADAFERAIGKSTGRSLLLFHASWCAPCRHFVPVYNAVAGEMDSQARFFHADVDKVGELAARLRIEGVPTTVVFDNGHEVQRFVGATPDKTLRDAARGTPPT